MANLNELKQAVKDGDLDTAVDLTKEALAEKTEPQDILNKGLIAAMDEIGELFSKNEIYIPEMMIAARAMKSAMEILEPVLVQAGVKPLGNFVIGTVAGDQHDIGKNLVAIMMKGTGFKVFDLGVDVPIEKFIEEAKAANADVIGISTLLTTTMPVMAEVVKAAKQAGVKSKIMVGGAPLTQAFAEKIGADGYAPDAASAVLVAKDLVA